MPGFWQRFRPRGRRKRILLAGLILLPILGIGSAELTSQSWFCNSCHIMNPYYASWQHGPHKGVECVKCHISPGLDNFLAAKFNGLGQVVDDVLYRTSSKPSASVSQLACTRSGCHSIEKVRNTAKVTGTYKFRHDKHLDLEFAGVKLACGTCHSHIKGDQHFEVNKEVCINCHLIQNGPVMAVPVPEGSPPVKQPMIRMVVREGHTTMGADAPPKPEIPGAKKLPPNACTTCHEPPKGIIERNGLKIDHAQYLSYGAACESCHRSATATPEPIADSRCLECHNFGIERNSDTVQMHKTHLEGRHKIECFSCHGTIQHGTAAQSASLEQFDCLRCHSDQHAVQRSAYLATTAHTSNGAPAVSPMFLAHVDCNGCHIQKRPLDIKPDSGATVAMAVPQACDACHKPGLGEKMIPLWQTTTHTLYDQVAASLADAESKEGVDKPLLDQTRALLQLIRVDGSWGVHNPRYTQKILEEARDKLAAARKPKAPAP